MIDLDNLMKGTESSPSFTESEFYTLTWVLGNADVLSVSCVSSAGFRLGTLRTRAAWSLVAAVAVIRYPQSHLR